MLQLFVAMSNRVVRINTRTTTGVNQYHSGTLRYCPRGYLINQRERCLRVVNRIQHQAVKPADGSHSITQTWSDYTVPWFEILVK